MSPHPSSDVWKNRQSNLLQKGKLKVYFLSLEAKIFTVTSQKDSRAIMRVAAAPVSVRSMKFSLIFKLQKRSLS